MAAACHLGGYLWEGTHPGGYPPCPGARGAPPSQAPETPLPQPLELKAAPPAPTYRGPAELLPPEGSQHECRVTEVTGCGLRGPPAFLPAFPTNLVTLKRGKLMLFLMKRVKFSASWRRAGLEKTTLTHHPLPRNPSRAHGSWAGGWDCESPWDLPGSLEGWAGCDVDSQVPRSGAGASLAWAAHMGCGWGSKKWGQTLPRAQIQTPLCLGWGPCSLLPAPGKDRALPWDVVVHLHRAPAEDLTGLHGVVEGHALARADACSEVEALGTHPKLALQRRLPRPCSWEPPVMGHPRAEA